MIFLFLFSTSTLTGQAAQTFNILRYLVKCGHQVLAIADQNRVGNLNSCLEKAGAILLNDISISHKNKLINKCREVLRLRSVVMDIKPDFVITSFSNDHFVSYLALRDVNSKPRVVRFYHSKKVRSDWIHKSIYKNTDIFVFYDCDIYAEFSKKYSCMKDKFFLLPAGVDTDVFIPVFRSTLRDKFGLNKDSFVVGYVGMFQKGRMHRELIDLFFALKKRVDNSQLLMVGSGETFYDIYRYAYKRLGKTDVVFTGFVDENTLVDAYNVMDIFILLKGGQDSSLRMLYEAQSCGTYILTYKSYPASELINVSEYGDFIVDVTDIEKTADIIFSSIKNIKNEMRYLIHQRVKSRFDYRMSAELFLKICENLYYRS
ncbi:MAG: glycosyltransferase family 4 protein [Deltaproteobacteria bacterium]|nr:glycosyltransferase family 4 protein [Deltaproteobacteria bacterium]